MKLHQSIEVALVARVEASLAPPRGQRQGDIADRVTGVLGRDARSERTARSASRPSEHFCAREMGGLGGGRLQTVWMTEPGPVEGAVSTGIWTAERLEAAERSGHRLKFLFFWGHTARAGSRIGPHVLSQWYEHRFDVDGITYRSAEHFMMAEKARLFADDETLDAILGAESPGAAKALGRRVRGFSEERWSRHRLEIVVRGSAAKFGSSPELEEYLVGSGERVLVEASPTDLIWGIGLAADVAAASCPSEWRGQNLLGLALMYARAELIAVRRNP